MRGAGAGSRGGVTRVRVRRPMRCWGLGVLALVGWPGVVVGQGVDCSKWNSWGFFNDLTADDVRDCLEAGADVNARDERGYTPLHSLHSMIGSRDPEATTMVVLVLLEAGADVMAQSSNGDTPLHEAVRRSEIEVVEALLTAGADVAARNTWGATPLHYAAIYGDYPEMVKVLLTAGADLGARAEYGDTPLHEAATQGPPPMIDALLNAGANPRTRNQSGKTPWDLARERGETDDDFKTSKAYWRLYELNFPGEGIDGKSPGETGDTT